MSKKYIKRKSLQEVEIIAEEHAEWFVEIISPILKSVAKTFFIHGYKHGIEKKKEENNCKEIPEDEEQYNL
jgi:hypothetical protein